MSNALTTAAVLPTHLPSTAGVVDLRGRLHACPADERAAWLCLHEQLELALRQHAHELHFDDEPRCLRFRCRSVVTTTEHQLLLDDETNRGLMLLGRQLWSETPEHLSHRAWFVIGINEQDLLFQVDRVRTSSGTGLTLRPLYDAKYPVPQLEQFLALPGQAQSLRKCLQHKQGLILLADKDRTQKVRTARAIAQCLTGPEQRILLSETSCHPMVPGVTQIALPLDADKQQRQAWRQACDMSFDVLIALECDREATHLANHHALVVQGVCVDSPGLALSEVMAHGAHSHTIAQNLSYVLTQHRVALACDYCQCPTTAHDRLEGWINKHSPVRKDAISEWLSDRLSDNYVETPGCISCQGTGVGSVTTLIDCIKVSEEVQEALFNTDIRKASHTLDSHSGFANKIMALAKDGKITMSHAADQLEKQRVVIG